MELTRIPFIVTNIFASSDNHLYFNSNFEDWFKSWIGIKTEIKLFNTTCWRQHKNSLLYSEILSGINSLVLNLPLIFVIELSVGDDEYVYSSYTHISPALSFSKKKKENIVDLITPSPLSLSINSSLHSLTFNKHPTPTIPVNYSMKGQRSPFINI